MGRPSHGWDDGAVTRAPSARHWWELGALVALAVLYAPAVGAAVTLKVQLFAAAFAVGMLRLLDLPVYQRGVVIELPAMTLQVAEACNGLRFLMALLVLTAAFAQVTQRSVPRKIALVAS